MSNQESEPSRSALTYAVAADPHWSTAGATRLAGALALPERRATRSHAGTPYNLNVYDLALDLDRALEAFTRRHGDEVPAGRTAVADYAACLAEGSDVARVDYGRLRLVHDLRAALTIGDADEILGKLTCPTCQSWSLVGTRMPAGGWAATCRIVRCATAPGVPRVFTLAEVARHHITHRDVAAA
ncbi:hypothetical protein ACGF3G_00775 [Streptomyces sp. NPDC048179]|uniref:hypothetical protein n=1 Tax=Streptomyces sp. NPDC048179 TaxID=3365506 RepID=UPI00371E0EE2